MQIIFLSMTSVVGKMTFCKWLIIIRKSIPGTFVYWFNLSHSFIVNNFESLTISYNNHANSNRAVCTYIHKSMYWWHVLVPRLLLFCLTQWRFTLPFLPKVFKSANSMVQKYRDDASNTSMIEYWKTFRYPPLLKVTFLSHKVEKSELPYSTPFFWLTDKYFVCAKTDASWQTPVY